MTASYTPGSAASLPGGAAARLKAMRGSGDKPAFFTSDLSVDEFLLVEHAGFQALGLVLGSCIYHVGFQWQKWNVSQELTVLTQAMFSARELAMTRMEEEADLLGADGIVGVRLTVNLHAWSSNVIEFLAIGTAVKNVDPKSDVKNWRAPNGKPFQSDLSGQDFWTLLRAGYRPLGFVMGNCVYHIAHQGLGQWLANTGKNLELPNYTQALFDARELAMERMQQEAEELGAEGIVGVTVEESNHTWGSHVLEFSAVGTAVMPTSTNHQIPAPTLVLTVND